MTGSGSGSGWVRTASAVTRTSLRRTVQDRTSLFFILVLPVVIMVIIGGTVFASVESDAAIGVFVPEVGAPASPEAESLIDGLEEAEQITVERFDDRDEMVRAIRTAELSAGIAVPPDLDAALASGDPAEITLIAVPDTGGSATVRSRLLELITRRSEEIAATRLAADIGLDDATSAAAFETAQSLVPEIEVTVVSVDETDVETNQYSYTAAANLVLFVFINSMVGGSVLTQNRELGIFRRALAAPVTSTQMLVGVGASRLVFALLQSVILVGIAALLFDVSFGDPVAASALVVVFATLSAAAGVLIGALANSADSAQAIAIPLSIAMAMLGGCMWPLEIVGDMMRSVGHITPHAWAMDAWIDLVFDGENLAAIVPELAVLAGFTAIALILGGWRLRKSLST